VGHRVVVKAIGRAVLGGTRRLALLHGDAAPAAVAALGAHGPPAARRAVSGRALGRRRERVRHAVEEVDEADVHEGWVAVLSYEAISSQEATRRRS